MKNCELDLKGVLYPTFIMRGKVGGLLKSSVILLLPLSFLNIVTWCSDGYSCSGMVGKVLKVESHTLDGKGIIALHAIPSLNLQGERIWSS